MLLPSKRTGFVWQAGREAQQASYLETDCQQALVTYQEDMNGLLKILVVVSTPTCFCCCLSVEVPPTSFLPGGRLPVSWRIKPVSLIYGFVICFWICALAACAWGGQMLFNGMKHCDSWQHKKSWAIASFSIWKATYLLGTGSSLCISILNCVHNIPRCFSTGAGRFFGLQFERMN